MLPNDLLKTSIPLGTGCPEHKLYVEQGEMSDMNAWMYTIDNGV